MSNDQPGVRNVLATYREQEQSTDHDTRRIELRRSQRVARRPQPASPTRWHAGARRSWHAAAPSRAEQWPSHRSASPFPTHDLDDLRAAHRTHAVARPGRRRRLGLRHADLGYLQELVEFWADGFNWRSREEVLNSLPQFRAVLDAPGFEHFGVHFVHQPGVGPAPLPLVLSHGWPSTHYEYHDVVGPLANPAALRR